MRLINTHLLTDEDLESLPPWDSDQIYNGFDVAITRDVHDALWAQCDEQSAKTYEFSRALQGPTLEMRLRGVLVDQVRKQEVIDEMMEKIDRLESQLDRIIYDGVGMPTFNWRSNKDLQSLFYEYLSLPPQYNFNSLTTNRSAREELIKYPTATQICSHLNLMADLAKKVSVLQTEIDPDGRIRTSYNIAGTNTGRFSSSFSEFGTGGNLQNIEEGLRSIYIADPGFKFAKCDAKSGESFCVGATEWNLFRDSRYLDACESGDPHTAVARICWPNLGWTGDLSTDKALAEQPFYRHYTYRFMCKKLGHGSNYGGRPEALAEQTKLDTSIIEPFQSRYFMAFPAHRRWHEWVDRELRTRGYLDTVDGLRRRYFFGRRTDPDIYREALAYNPQGSLANIVNTAMLRIYRLGICPIVMHDHDALTFMYPEAQEDVILGTILPSLVVDVPLEGGRRLRIPYDCKVGWNKADYNDKTNPEGLRDYRGPGTESRHRRPIRSYGEYAKRTALNVLDRVIRRAN